MNKKEITWEILKDLEKLNKSTIDRLTDEYDRERRKFKIDKVKNYPKNYSIKTASKNTWVIFFEKSPSIPKYRNVYDAVGCCAVYYYSSNGLKAFRYNELDKYLEVFNGHFFARYNERMQLKLSKPLDIIKHFFSNSGYLQISIIKKDERQYTTGLCKEGMALGEYYNAEVPWLIHKTFINHDLKKPCQQRAEEMMLAQVEIDLLIKSLELANNLDPQFIISKNVMAQIASK